VAVLEVSAIGESEPLVGRESERVVLRSFLDGSLADGGACLLLGEPGVGKTRLLQLCAELAESSGARVLWASGAQFEAELGFSALNQLLRPLLAGLHTLPGSSSSALRSVLGIADPDVAVLPLAAYEAALALLEVAAREAPLLVLLDDVHWMDASSAAAFAFIARRLAGQPIGLVGTVRTGEPSHFDATGLPAHSILPLSAVSADKLLLELDATLPATVRRRLVQLSAGYPLALVEWRSDVERIMGYEADTLPLPRRLEQSFAARIGRLPARARDALLILALDGRNELQKLADVGVALDDLAPAESAGALLVGETTGRVEFRHPLFRSALVASSTSAERRRIHRKLAESRRDDPDRRAWHLAAAATSPDEKIALLLHDLAHRSLARGDVQGASAGIVRAALLSPATQDRTRRLAEAAFLGADVAGDLDRASKLLADAGVDLGNGPGSLYATVARAQVAVNSDGDHRVAIHRIEEAVLRGGHGWRADDEELIATLRTWLLLCSYAGEPEDWETYFATLERVVPAVPEPLLAESWAVGDTARRGGAARQIVIDLSADQQPDSDPTLAISMSFAAMYVDLVDLWRPSVRRFITAGREGGAPRPYARSLAFLSINEFLHGRWQEAQRLAEEGARLCEQHDFGNGAWYFAYVNALLAAARGDTAVAWERAEFADVECARRGSWGAQRFSYQPRTLAAVADGNWDEAYRTACRLGPPGSFPRFTPPAMWVALDLVEAAMRTGRTREARRHAHAMVEAGLPSVSSRMALLTAGAVALAEEGDQWRDLFERALATPESRTWPFDLARVQLAYGERLRRAVATSRAREVLHDALEIFQRLGAVPWAERAANELRAAGDSLFHSAAGHSSMPDLTPQELAVAEMAASGLTNKEIGSRLFLSPRTVSGHLYRVFPKLGITSRAGLRDALARHGR
jgi:DNA-binding CsgD family transcriptional regulator